MKEIKLRYSGKASHAFWRRVNSLKGKQWKAAYAMGVMLQNIERPVLTYINEMLKRLEKMEQ